MTPVEITYAASGTFVSLAGLTMIAVYSATNPWWRNHTGRMLITYALAETGMSAIFAVLVIFKIDPLWFRWIWVSLQATVGVVLCYQTAMILRLHRQAQRSRVRKARRSKT